MKLNIALVTMGLNFNGGSLEKESLGGSETAFVYVARALAKRGHSVNAFCGCTKPGEYDKVNYYPVEAYEAQAAIINYDIVIVSRWPEFMRMKGDAGLKVLWCHDTLVDSNRFMGGLYTADLVMLLSDFHIENYTEQVSEVKNFSWKTRNGVDLDFIKEVTKGVKRDPNKLIYTSRPERGLHTLLSDIFPRLLEKRPELKLHFANYSLQGMQIPSQVQSQIQASYELAAEMSDSVVNMGHLTKEQLYKEMASASLALYPTSFPEISPLHGDSLVETTSGRKPIRDLVGKKDFHVYSVNENGDLSLSKVLGVFKTRENAKMLKISFKADTGCKAKEIKTLTCTPDHEIMLRSGEYVKAEDLVLGSRLKVFHRRSNEHGNGYDTIGVTDRKVVPEHWFVFEKTQRNLVEGEIVDHEDRNTRNNDPSNLKVYENQSKHRKSHFARMTSEERELDKAKRISYLLKTSQGDPTEVREKKRKARLVFWDKINSLPEDERKAFIRRREERKLEKRLSNHRVVSIEVVDNSDAFCMEVEPDHNFVANGVVVHNCISAIEYQACGTPIITTGKFALTETCGPESSILIPGMPPKQEYCDKFVEYTLQLLDDTKALKEMSTHGPEWVKSQGYEWDTIAYEWEKKFVGMLEERWNGNKSRVYKKLEKNCDYGTIKLLKKKCGNDGDVESLDQVIQGVLDTADTLSFPNSATELKESFQAAMPRFDKCNKFLMAIGFTPKTVLDYGCGYTPYGMVLKKALPEAQVVFSDFTVDPLNQLDVNLKGVDKWEKQIASSPNDLLKLYKKKSFDLVFLGDILELQENPQKFLAEISELVSDNGLILLTTRCGQSESDDRIWNFTYSDLQDIFSKSGKFSTTFVASEATSKGNLLGHWVTLTSPSTTYGKIDLEKKALVTRPYESIACCIITNNQEDNIGKMLKSVKQISDRIIVVDTLREDEERDSTLEIAKSYGAEIRHLPFDNFSQVRNASIEGLTEDWILWIDTDEVLIEPQNLKKYLSNNVYEGFAIKQVHLTLDHLSKTYDIPVRLFRNRPIYKFTGLIHEHAERVDRSSYDDPIAPRMLIPDVDIAHYGYLNERGRRQKCSNRNMALLQRATVEDAERKLTWVLVIRDYMNIFKWENEKPKVIQQGSRSHQLLEAAVKTFLEHFPTEDTKQYKLAFPMYQEALMVLGKLGLPFENRSEPPFNINIAMGGAIGGEARTDIQPDSLWFIDKDHFMQVVKKKSAELLIGLGVAEKEEYADLLTEEQDVTYGAPANASAILTSGINVFKRGS